MSSIGRYVYNSTLQHECHAVIMNLWVSDYVFPFSVFYAGISVKLSPEIFACLVYITYTDVIVAEI